MFIPRAVFTHDSLLYWYANSLGQLNAPIFIQLFREGFRKRKRLRFLDINLKLILTQGDKMPSKFKVTPLYLISR